MGTVLFDDIKEEKGQVVSDSVCFCFCISSPSQLAYLWLLFTFDLWPLRRIIKGDRSQGQLCTWGSTSPEETSELG